MPKTLNRLAARKVETLTKPGRHADGGGLYLVVDKPREEGEKAVARRWVFLFRWNGKLKEMGLGGAAAVSLAEARRRADDARRLVAEGKNPIDERRAEAIVIPTFGAFADKLVSEILPGFRNEKHRWQWEQTLRDYCKPIRSMPVNEVDTEGVLRCLRPLWTEKNETASRLRGRIERVLDAAKAQGFRSGENPARWRGHLDAILPKRKKLARGHHPAMPYAAIPEFMVRLRARPATAALALEFLILTAARTNEVLGARPEEFDLAAAIWTVPPERMKTGRAHRVPLSGRAVEIVAAAKELGGDYVFRGPKEKVPLSQMAMMMLLRRMGHGDLTVHGFRSTFRDWCGEETDTPREIAEAALAHVVGSEVERSYRRGDALEKRRALMSAWAAFVAGEGRVEP